MNGDFIKVSTTRDIACIEVIKNYKKISSHILNTNDIKTFIVGLEDILFDLKKTIGTEEGKTQND